VRGIYDGLKQEEVEKLITDIKGLLKERKSSNTGISTPFRNNPT
jgi:hemerythrin superfamily protein